MMRPDAKVEKVYLYPKPVDFRKSIYGLAALVELDIKVAVFDPVLFVFLNRARNRVKILYWERNGFCLWLKRLEAERFKSHPEPGEDAIVLTAQEHNQRLAAIHAFARFVGEHSLEHIAWCGQIRLLPFKRTMRAAIAYLDQPEVDALLAAPDRRTAQGSREYVLLLFLYNSGARADEAPKLQIRDIDVAASSVRILGKGGKVRHCPLWPRTLRALGDLIGERAGVEPVFLNCRGCAITRFGIHTLVERSARTAQVSAPSMANKRVSPHTIRHTTACHLFRAGVDINTIRGWLGHASLDTTNVYAEIDLEMKANALAKCDIGDDRQPVRRWHEPGLMAFLRTL